MKKIYLLILLFFGMNSISNAQTLAAGDIVVIGCAADTGNTPSVDEFTWVPLVNLSAGTKIYFTDAGYNAVDADFMGTGVTDEILVRYIVPAGGIAAGTIMLFTEASLPADYTAIVGTKFGDDGNGLLTFPNAGDQITVFQSTDDENTPATFGDTNFTAIFMVTTGTLSFTALNVNTAGITPATNIDNVTNLAPGLTDGVNAIAVGTGPLDTDESDNARYEGITAGTRAELLAAVTQLSNWVRYDAAFANDIDINTVANGWTANGVAAFTVNGTGITSAALTEAKVSEYTRMPITQSIQPDYSAKITNSGTVAIDARVRLRVMDPTATVVETAISAMVSLAAGDTSLSLAVTPMFVPTVGTYTFTYDIIDITDNVISTADVTYTILYTNTEMARDDDAAVGQLGIGAGNGGYLGQTFQISNDTSLSSVAIFTTGNGDAFDVEMGAAVFKMVAGVPQLVYTAPSQQVLSGALAGWFTYAVNPPLALNAGDVILVCGQEYANTISVALSNTIFTAGSTYVNWPTTPFGTWAHNEDFGAGFAKSYMIRPNFLCTMEDPVVTSPQEFCGSATVNDLAVVGTDIMWFEDAVGGPALAGNTALVSGTYYVSQSDGQCQSARVAVAVSITPITSTVTTINTCDSYTWPGNGITYTDSGTYSVVTGCHTETLDLTIAPFSTNVTVVENCDSYTWAQNGVTYTDSGMYSVVSGCVTETLDLTIIPSSTTVTVVENCDSYTWSQTGVTYTDSGMYSVVMGCVTETLDLTIIPSSTTVTAVENCDSYTWSENGVTYTDSGMYSIVTGCHTETLDLTIIPFSTTVSVVEECYSYTWPENGVTYTDSGMYDVVTGCHTETLDLTIIPEAAILAQPEDQDVIAGVMAVFTVTASATMEYQWQSSDDGGANWVDIVEGDGYSGTDSDTLTIDGEAVTVSLNGLMIRVIVTNGICNVLTSNAAMLSVVLGVESIRMHNLTVYPNPAVTKVYIDYDGDAHKKVIVSDMNGRQINATVLENNATPLDVSNLAAGVYVLRIETMDGVVNRKLIKQ